MLQHSIIENSRETPVQGEYDVIVCGGGLGGTTAAIAAARTGAKTLLIERNSFLGGVATAGMCCSIFNCYYTGGVSRKLAVNGIPVEVANRLADAMGYGTKWHHHKGHIIYDIEIGKLVLQDMVEQAGAELMLQVWVADAIVENDTVRGVIVETKAGRVALLANVVVDATGDADVVARAGAPLHTHEKGHHSLCFRFGNVDVDAFVNFFRQQPEQYPELMDVEWTTRDAIAQYDDCGTFLFPHGGGMVMDAFQRAKADGVLPPQVGIQDATDACQMHAIHQTGTVHVITGFTHFDGLDQTMINRSILDGRRMAHIVAATYRRYIPGFEKSFIAGTAANLGVRTSRYLDGEFHFTSDMLANGLHQDDAVGRVVGWRAQVLNVKAQKTAETPFACQVLNTQAADLPYRCLLPKDIDGLLVGAGRSISTDDPWLLRVMVHTMVVGQAAGAAAAVAVQTGTSTQKVDVPAVQTALNNLYEAR